MNVAFKNFFIGRLGCVKRLFSLLLLLLFLLPTNVFVCSFSVIFFFIIFHVKFAFFFIRIRFAHLSGEKCVFSLKVPSHKSKCKNILSKLCLILPRRARIVNGFTRHICVCVCVFFSVKKGRDRDDICSCLAMSSH